MRSKSRTTVIEYRFDNLVIGFRRLRFVDEGGYLNALEDALSAARARHKKLSKELKFAYRAVQKYPLRIKLRWIGYFGIIRRVDDRRMAVVGRLHHAVMEGGLVTGLDHTGRSRRLSKDEVRLVRDELGLHKIDMTKASSPGIIGVAA